MLGHSKVMGFYSKQNRKPLEGLCLKQRSDIFQLTLAAVWRKDCSFGGKSRSRENREEALVFQMTENGDLGWGGHHGGVRRGWIQDIS